MFISYCVGYSNFGQYPALAAPVEEFNVDLCAEQAKRIVEAIGRGDPAAVATTAVEILVGAATSVGVGILRTTGLVAAGTRGSSAPPSEPYLYGS